MRGLPPKAYHRVSVAAKRGYTKLVSKFYSGWFEISNVQDRHQQYRINSRSIEPNPPSMILRHVLHQVGPQLLNSGMNKANLITVYDPNHVPPPIYQPPAGSSKANPSQDYDVPPPGPPPISVPITVERVGDTILSPPPTARSSRSPWLNKFKRTT